MTNDVSTIIFKHGEDDYSIWTLDLSDAEQAELLALLEPYTHSGYSVRGSKPEVLHELYTEL